MEGYLKPEKIRIVYFSGTGGTKRAAEKLAERLSERGVHVIRQELSIKEPPENCKKEDFLIVMYPVYALNAPGPIYDYIKKHEKADNTPAAVISVSGGGEVTPNRASRVRTIRLLEKKGYCVVYERMLVMPSNVFVKTPFDMAVYLLRVLPEKAGKITEDLLGGVTRRLNPGLLNRMLAVFGEFEKTGARLIGRHIKVSETCTGCGICSEHCPMGNITLKENRPVFGKKCVTCLKCFYHCPEKALTPGYGKFIVLKEGFSLAEIEKAVSAEAGQETPEIDKSIWFGGLKKYLEEKD